MRCNNAELLLNAEDSEDAEGPSESSASSVFGLFCCFVASLLSVAVSVAAIAQQPANCNAPTPAPILHVELPGNPFEPLPSADGCWLFVTMPQGKTPGIAVLRRANGAVTLQHVIATPGNPTGAVLTHDGK